MGFKFPEIENIEISPITDDVYHVSQVKSKLAFTKCDGLIIAPRRGRNSGTIVIDLNLEPKYVYELAEYVEPVSNYIVSHGHLDHSAHVHVWEEIGARIHSPYPHNKIVQNYDNLIDCFQFTERIDKRIVEDFGRINGYQSAKTVKSFSPGSTLEFEEMEIKTVSLNGHTIGHTGFLLPAERIIHVSCLGFDLPKPEMDGFGPWYGFKQCSIEQTLEDINNAEIIYREQADYLTSSHSYVVSKPDFTPFKYMRDKIHEKQNIIDNLLKEFTSNSYSLDAIVDLILDQDIFFPKKKMDKVFAEMFRFMEYWIVRKHVEISLNRVN